MAVTMTTEQAQTINQARAMQDQQSLLGGAYNSYPVYSPRQTGLLTSIGPSSIEGMDIRHILPKVYLAAPYSQREQAKVWATQLAEGGCLNTGLWVYNHTTPMDELNPTTARKEAEMDLFCIDQADWVVFVSPEDSTTGGLHVEFGYALAKGKRLLLVGERTNVFHHLPAVMRRCATIADAIVVMKGGNW